MSRREEFARIASEMAEDPSHGYSQKPPSGRWGPDYDCSSLVYAAADKAGYSVGTGNLDGKVRFTGTMLKDFKDAGFQILPFANVGLGELEVGDILLNLALHAEVYVGEGQTVGAQASETGGYSGKAGDQTGREIERKPVYEYDKGWDYVLRPPEEPSEDEQEDQGGHEMPYPYSPTTAGSVQGYGNYQPSMPWPGAQTRQQGWPQGGYPANQGNMGGYPQGNLGQMNGYSQAGVGGYPQGQGGKQLTWVSGMEGARDHHLAPNSCEAMFDQQDPSVMYIKSTDQQGFPSIRVFKTQEMSEEMPQHHMPGEMGMYGQEMGGMSQQQQPGQFVSRQEFDELKEMISNVQSAISGSGFPQGNAESQSNSKQPSGRNSRSS